LEYVNALLGVNKKQKTMQIWSYWWYCNRTNVIRLFFYN